MHCYSFYRWFTLFVWALMITPSTQAQIAIPQEVRAINTIERLTSGAHTTPGSMMPTMPMDKPTIVGERYLNQTWNKASILLYGSDKTLEGYPVKLDVLANELDVRLNKNVAQSQVLKGMKVKSFVWADSLSGQPSYFVNGKEVSREDGTPFVGFFEVMVDGNLMLLKFTSAEILKSNYNVALSVGNKNHQVVQHSDFYYQLDGKTYKLPRRMKKILEVFPERKKEMRAFVKKNRLRPSEEHHLEALFQHYNQ